MPLSKVAFFLGAKKAIRLHPDWTDEEVREHIGAKPGEADDIIAEARKDVLAGG